MQRGQAVLVDTNIIIEAVRTGCWNALTMHFSVQSVKSGFAKVLTAWKVPVR